MSGQQSEMQALAESTFSGYRIDRIFVGDRQWDGPGITAIPPYKNKPFWEIRIWNQETIFASGLSVLIEATKVAAPVNDDDEIPEEE